MKFFHTPTLIQKLFPSVIWKIDTITTKELFLTFDDGPNAHFTTKILDMLERYKGEATFFVLGEKAAQHQEIINTIFKRGHLISNHSYSHQRLLFKSKLFIKQEIIRTDTILDSILQSSPLHFRPPYGQLTPSIMKVAGELSKTIILWTLNSYDFSKKISEEIIIKRILSCVKPGYILLFHDNQEFGEKTLNCLSQLLPALSTKGYTFRTLPRLEPLLRPCR